MIKYLRANCSVQLETQAKTIDKREDVDKFFRRVCTFEIAFLKNRRQGCSITSSSKSFVMVYCVIVVQKL